MVLTLLDPTGTSLTIINEDGGEIGHILYNAFGGVLAVEADGTAHVAWTENGGLYYAQVAGETVTAPQMLAEAGSYDPAIAVEADGSAHLLWRQDTYADDQIYYTAVGGAAELVSAGDCPVSNVTAPALAVDGDGQLYAAWGAPDGRVCYAVRSSGSWSVTGIGRQAWNDRFELKVADDGAVYLMRGIRSYFDDTDPYQRAYTQESLYLERYRDGLWQGLPANLYPTQDFYTAGWSISVLDGDMDIDAAGNASLAWLDDGETWQNTGPTRLRSTTILSTTSPQITKHYYANGQRVASRVDGELYYLLGDHLGSTSLVVDAQGDEVGHAIYDAYGQMVENTIPLTLTDRLYTGQVFDASTGLYYYNARYYDPVAGQFTQPDSLVADPLDPAAWNKYSYVYGNPTNFVDPTGHFAWDLSLDIASFSMSLNDFVHKPTLGNFVGLALDTIGLLPIIPSIGALRHAGKLDDVSDAARGASRFSPGCAINSFTAGTLVHTDAGLRPIEEIKAGDEVFAQDPETGENGYFEVVALHSHPVNEILHITVDDDGSDSLPAEVMEITPNHSVYVKGKGWVDADKLAVGDKLRQPDGGWVQVLAVERVLLAAPQMVYNLTVRGVHSYFVLEVGVLVHNCWDPTNANGFRGLANYPDGFPNRVGGERFYGSPKGKFLDELSVEKRKDRMAIYVITKKGEIRVSLMDRGGRSYRGRTMHHSYLVNGENVYGAGEMYFDAAGQLKTINAISGHYNTAVWDMRPFGPQFREYLQKLLTERYGFQLDDPRKVFDRSMYPAWP